MISIHDPRLLPTDEVFSHISESGKVSHFAVGIMRRYIASLTIAPIVSVQISATDVERIRAERGIEQPRLDRLIEPYIDEPVIFCAMPHGTCLLIDGHHRYVRRHELGYDFIKAHIVSPKFWETFLLDLPRDVEATKKIIGAK